MHHTGTKELRTDRLLLRQYRAGDEGQMFDNLFSDPLIKEHVNWEDHKSIEDTRKFLNMHLEQYRSHPDFYGWAIEKDREIIGSIGAFDVNEPVCSCEIGYSLGSRFWGQGIMTEAVRAVLDYLFHAVGFNRVAASYNAENTASEKVLKKAGMQYEGTLREGALHKDGTFGDLVLYSILKRDWQDSRIKF